MPTLRGVIGFSIIGFSSMTTPGPIKLPDCKMPASPQLMKYPIPSSAEATENNLHIVNPPGNERIAVRLAERGGGPLINTVRIFFQGVLGKTCKG